MLCGDLGVSRGWEVEWEGGSRGRGRMYTHKKLTQHCKAIILQLKKSRQIHKYCDTYIISFNPYNIAANWARMGVKTVISSPTCVLSLSHSKRVLAGTQLPS